MSAPVASPSMKIPRLRNGDHLDSDEFERRYDAMPDLKKAELLDGVVYLPGPTPFLGHGQEHAHLMFVLGYYRAYTPGVQAGDSPTVRLDSRNEPQPDCVLLIDPKHGGRVTFTDGYITGGPELAAEVAPSSVSYDAHVKRSVYQQHGICEYLLWRVEDQAIDWFALQAGQYVALPAGPDGIVRSEVFPGLWLDPAALMGDDLGRVLAVLQQDLASPEHAAFVARLRQAATP